MTTNCIGYPIRYPIGSHRVDPNRGRIPRPDPSRPVPLTTGALAPMHRCSLYSQPATIAAPSSTSLASMHEMLSAGGWA